MTATGPQPMTENMKTPVGFQKTAWDTENSEAHSGSLRACFKKLDRFGDSDPRQRTIVGFVFSVVFWIVLCAYAISKYMLYQSRPPQQRSDTIWSVSQGPYPLPLTCFAEFCWVSMNYASEASGQGAACVAQVPASQKSQCIPLGHGEQIVLQTCYSQLPGQGVRLHFGGTSMWGVTGAKLGLGSAVGKYGFASTSDMVGMAEGSPVMKFLTPIRAGVTLLQYVRTDNETISGGEGRERHEWFSVPLSSEAPDSDFVGDPCSAAISSNAGLSRAALLMAPDYTHIQVREPRSMWLDLIGDVGGAKEILDWCFLLLLLVPTVLFYRSEASERIFPAS